MAKPLFVIGLSSWAVVAFFGAQVLAGVLIIGAAFLFPAVEGLSPAIQTTILAALSYILTFVIIIGVPRLIAKSRTSLRELGLQRSVEWKDIGLSLGAFLPYFILTALVTSGVIALFQLNDSQQTQAIPFENLQGQTEYIVAFITLVVLAPLAEELVFRGYLLGKLSGRINSWIAMFVVAFVFGALHLLGPIEDGQLVIQWTAGVDTFVLGVVLGALRLITGSVWASVILHMLKNALAYYFLFINPSLLGTM